MTTQHTEAELAERLRKAINGVRAVMVGVTDHFSPMRGHQVAGEAPIWFICRRDVGLVHDVGGDGKAAVVNVVSEDHHLHASVSGQLSAERDQARIDQFWSSVADAWLPEGRTSPEVILLRFEPGEAHVWISDNAFKLAWEVAKANFNREEIDSGEKGVVHMGGAAPGTTAVR